METQEIFSSVMAGLDRIKKERLALQNALDQSNEKRSLCERQLRRSLPILKKTMENLTRHIIQLEQVQQETKLLDQLISEVVEQQYGKINFIVPKRLFQGEEGALFYVNADNNRIYLNKHMKRKLAQGQLSGCIGPLCNHFKEQQ